MQNLKIEPVLAKIRKFHKKLDEELNELADKSEEI